MTGVQAEAGDTLQMIVDWLQIILCDSDAFAALAANQVVMLVFSRFINDAPAADMGNQGQAVGDQEIEGAVDRRLGQPGHFLTGTLENFRSSQVPVRFLDHLQDG